MKAVISDAKDAAKKMAKEMQDAAIQQQLDFEKVIDEIKKMSPELGGFDELAALLELPDDQFALLAPLFLSELEKAFNNPNDQMMMVQSLNLAGLKAEDARKEYLAICNMLDTEMQDALSAQKRDFIKCMLGFTYNAVNEAEGISKRHILIPIEYCHEDAKRPAYAHLGDAGMDIYLTEDVSLAPGETKALPTGIKVAVPLGYELQIRPKSGRSLRTKLRVANTPGTIKAA